MTRYSITRNQPSEHSPFADVHGIDYMNVTVNVSEEVMKRVEKLDVEITQFDAKIPEGAVQLRIYAEGNVILANMPVANWGEQFHLTNLHKTYNEERKVYYFSVTGYVCAEILAPKLAGHVILPDDSIDEDIYMESYHYPTNARWVSPYGVELDKEVA